MKSLFVHKVGSLVAGSLMLGAALAGAVSAGLDDTGLTKDFFYDANYNPVVQIVVGEKGMATDAVAAGNIAATIGNLAYASKTKTVGTTEGAASGQVTIGVSAVGATGKFKQAREAALTGMETDLDAANGPDFYFDDNVGLIFSFQGATFGTSPEKFERGEFISYSLACDTQERSEAGVLKEGEYKNVHCLFCQTLCLSSLENPSHEIKESIIVDGSKIAYLESGLGKDDAELLILGLLKDTITYVIDAGEVPISSKITLSGDDIDFEWRGKMILFGEEYYVKDIKGTDKIYLAKGSILDDISSEGYTAEYMGYKFKIDHLIYSAEYQVAGILLDVEKPDGTVVQTQVSKMANGVVDDIEIAGVYAEEADQVATASILVYDTTTNVVLEDGKDISLGGEVKKYWRTEFATRAVSASNDISEYDGAAGTVLENITIKYRQKVPLLEGWSLPFPSTYKLTFDGFRTTDFRTIPVSGEGEGNIKLEKDGNYQLLLSFTDDGGNRWDGVRMDMGPFSKGDRFILGGKVYEYDDTEEKTNLGASDTMKVTFKDLVDGGKESFELAAVTSPASFYLYTESFEESAENDDEIKVEPDADANDTDVFLGAEGVSGSNIPVLYDAGDIYFVDSTNASTLNGLLLGVWSSQVGTVSKFELNGNALTLSVVNENGVTDQNDYSLAASSIDVDDTLIVVSNEDGEKVVIDLYDRNYNDSTDTYYDESLAADLTAIPWNATTGTPAVRLRRDTDTLLILPQGGDRINIDWGSDYRIDGVEIQHPQEKVYATYFIGTSEESTVLESVITEADVGTTKTAGCCTFTVEKFGVAGGASATVTETKVNAVPSNLVVPEISADTSKNLVIVGGPAVNGMTTVTAEQIAAASQKYIVKKDGRKLIVAGWTAADTVDAGNALIDWLKANIH